MKKLLSLTLALCLCAALVSCGNSDESSKTAELEKRVAELESQLEQSTTTTTAATTTTVVTTTPETTTTTAQTFDTSYYEYESSLFRVTKYDIDLYAAPDKNSEVLYSIKNGTVLEVIGEVDNDWEAVLINNNIVFVEKVTLDVSTTSFSTTTTIVKMPVY